ncbi:unnamed protein product [Lactuca virosa]|uniref:Protein DETOXIFICATION n=1 Tax=Lactuca virosa TaxID=75947 RepID=A0AAU9N979_9ASTR|nr:unnamed protein product [Lactuca virosa]
MLVITQAFAGHLGDLELAAVSIATNVIVGFDIGLLLGMASALETLCGQAYGAKTIECWECIYNAHGSYFSYVVYSFSHYTSSLHRC